ncbi:hypothetical protein QFZ75_007987 [Streptomyces sp. V3I8]|nr:hypothetical protein [Streptomyces sp. V3I8]
MRICFVHGWATPEADEGDDLDDSPVYDLADFLS